MSYQPLLPGQGIKLPEPCPTVMGIVFSSGDLTHFKHLQKPIPSIQKPIVLSCGK